MYYIYVREPSFVQQTVIRFLTPSSYFFSFEMLFLSTVSIEFMLNGNEPLLCNNTIALHYSELIRKLPH